MAEAQQPGKRGASDEADPAAGGADRMKAAYAKAEVKNQKVRESLEPLEEGQRPTVVTVAAIFAGIVALIFWTSTGAALAGAEVNGSSPNIAQLVLTALVMSIMAIGMWRARYWAVLGFQMLLVLLIIAAIAGLVLAGTLLQFISTTILTVGLSVMFWFMVKAMARIQMPRGPNAR